jgi:FkbM family methyltransferase
MRFFHTLREKQFVLRQLQKGNPLPLLKYLIYRLRLSHFFSVQRKYYRLSIWYSPLAFWLWTRQEKPKSDELFYESFLHEGDIVVDCGAHVGTLAMTAASLVGTDGSVIACEMHPRTYSYLANNIRNNGFSNITAFNVAIGKEEKTVRITDEYVSDINHISEEGNLETRMVTLDALTANLSRIDLLKLDVEGYELQALQGALETLPKVKAVYFEAAERNFTRYGYALRDILLFLKEHGFVNYAFDQDGKTYEINEWYIPSVKYENLLALRKN